MFRLGKTAKRSALLAFILVVATTAILVGSGSIAGSDSSPAAGHWRLLPPAPNAVVAGRTSVWTGTELIVSGVTGAATDGSLLNSAEVTLAYNPATRAWRRMAAPPKTDNYCRRGAVWTGKEMLVWGCGFVAFDPLTNHWRRLSDPPAGQGIVVWTGREMIGWGGGCCGDADSGGAAYNPATDTWRKLAPSPLAAEQRPNGAWTGRELVLFISGVDAASGKPSPARDARAAAYNPTTDTWRRIAPQPEPRNGASVVWTDRELLVVGGMNARGVPASGGLAYNPMSNHWRQLAAAAGHTEGVTVWTGKRVLIWRGDARLDGLAYDPQANRWSQLPRAPLQRREGADAVWTGQAMIVLGGVIGPSVGSNTPPKYLTDGAVFTPGDGVEQKH
jgi:hypothetical protein